MYDLFCGQCAAPFKAIRPDKKWCSPYCAARAGRIRRKEHKGITDGGRDCLRCGTHFEILPPNCNSRYCSTGCAIEAARELRRIWARREYPKRRAQYEAARDFKDTALNRLKRRYPAMPNACEACGESRILEIAHKPEFQRNGAWRLASNTQGHMVWILCPTCHKLLDRGICTREQLGLS
jgi:hypothetical protein